MYKVENIFSKMGSKIIVRIGYLKSYIYILEIIYILKKMGENRFVLDKQSFASVLLVESLRNIQKHLIMGG